MSLVSLSLLVLVDCDSRHVECEYSHDTIEAVAWHGAVMLLLLRDYATFDYAK